MAKNLRAKIPKTDTLVVYDRNTEATSKFVQEIGMAASSPDADGKGMGIEVVKSPRAVAEKSVCVLLLSRSSISNDEHVPTQ